MIKDITEMLKMVLIILLWVSAYSIGLELVKAYGRSGSNNLEIKDFIPSVENSVESVYAKVNYNAKGITK